MLDLSAVFDNGEHKILLDRFKNWVCLSGMALRWLRMCLEGRGYFVSSAPINQRKPSCHMKSHKDLVSGRLYFSQTATVQSKCCCKNSNKNQEKKAHYSSSQVLTPTSNQIQNNKPGTPLRSAGAGQLVEPRAEIKRVKYNLAIMLPTAGTSSTQRSDLPQTLPALKRS